MTSHFTWNTVIQLQPTPIPWRRLWGTGLTTSLGLMIGAFLGHWEWGIWAFMGGFASLYVHDQPYRVRSATLACVGLGLAASMALGSLHSVWWHMGLALGVTAAAATYLTGVFDVPLPAGFMFVLTACISAALPLHPPGIILVRVLSVLGGAAIAWLVGMIDWVWNPLGPVSRAISQAYRALAQYGQALGSRGSSKAQQKAASAVMSAQRAVWAVHNPRLEGIAHQAQHVFGALVALAHSGSQPLDDSWTRLFHTMADHLSPTYRPTPLSSPSPHSSRNPSPAWTQWRNTIDSAVAVWDDDKPSVPEIHPPTVRQRLVHGFSPNSLVLPAFVRIGIAVAVSVWIAHLLGLAHPYWVPLTCAAVLQGVSTAIIAQRTVQRVIGTVLGLVLASVLIALAPGGTLTAIFIVALQLAMLFFIAKNYGVSVVFITALALIIIYYGTHPAAMPMIWARFKDTLLGAAIGFAAAIFLFGRSSSSRLADAAAKAAEDTIQLLVAILDGGDRRPLAELRHQALDALVKMHHLYETALGELLPHQDPSLFPLIGDIERLGYLVQAATDDPDRADASAIPALKDANCAISARLRGEGAAALKSLPHLSRYPAIARQLQELVDSLGLVQPP